MKVETTALFIKTSPLFLKTMYVVSANNAVVSTLQGTVFRFALLWGKFLCEAAAGFYGFLTVLGVGCEGGFRGKRI
ncbi:MAG: hypothetical protein IJV06_08755 [Bacteroidaceae bacterium]|nr:hypothetical protein [Bacteroidaceae bacterium]